MAPIFPIARRRDGSSMVTSQGWACRDPRIVREVRPFGDNEDHRRPQGGSPVKSPAFFDSVPAIAVHDALAQTLGAAADGVIEYTYVDAVKLAGHSCPTVAGAFLMTRAALARLYPEGLPQRGEMLVELRQALEEGVAGVIGNVAALVTGAANEGGFKGLGNRFDRRGLLRFGVTLPGIMRITRLDTGRAVTADYHPEIAPRPPVLKALMPAALAPGAQAPAREAFAAQWQAWVRAILESADDPRLVTLAD